MKPIPLRPDYNAARSRSLGQSLVRAAFAVGAAGRIGNAVEKVRELFPDDRGALGLLTRTDAVPANITSPAWGSSLSGTAVAEFVSSLAPASAAARLIGAGQRLTLNGVQKVLLPKRKAATPSATISWVGPGEPIGVYQGEIDSVTLGPPSKLAAIVVATSELLAYASGEQVIGQMLREDISASLDKSMFDDTTSDATRPDGLLAGVTPITASVATSAYDQMVEDLANLAGAITDLGGSGENIVYIMSPRQAMFAKLNLRTNEPVTIWPTNGLADGDIVAVETSAFCSAFSAEPTISLSREASLVMVNPGVQMVAATGGVSVFSDPSTSLFQTDKIGIRVTLPCAWCLRAPLVATITGVSWGVAPA
jgi:hypothetical protein